MADITRFWQIKKKSPKRKKKMVGRARKTWFLYLVALFTYDLILSLVLFYPQYLIFCMILLWGSGTQTRPYFCLR